MVTCRYCGSRDVRLNHDGLYVCRDCATVLGPLPVLPRRKPTKIETALAILYRYV